MTTDEIRRFLSRLESGECRFCGERWIHVYCHAPLVESPPDREGRTGWMKGPRMYRVVDSGLYDWTPEEWIGDRWHTEREALSQIQRAIAAPPRSSAQGSAFGARVLALIDARTQDVARPQPTRAPPPSQPVANQPTSQPVQRSLFA